MGAGWGEGGGGRERCRGFASGDSICICLLNTSILSQSHRQNVQNQTEVAYERFIYYTSSKQKLWGGVDRSSDNGAD